MNTEITMQDFTKTSAPGAGAAGGPVVAEGYTLVKNFGAFIEAHVSPGAYRSFLLGTLILLWNGVSSVIYTGKANN